MTSPARIEFPQQDYLIKIIGENTADFSLHDYVIECVNRHLQLWDESRMSMRESARAKYLAISIYCDIDSYEQLKALSNELNAHLHVRMVL